MRRSVVLLAVMGVVLLRAGGVALAATLIRGTNEDDSLNGTKGSDVIYGFGGNDFIGGYGGNDVMFGGNGHDDMDLTPSAEFGINAPGREVYFGGGGNDDIASWADEVIETGRVRGHARDNVFCGGGNDTVYADKKDFVASSCEKVKCSVKGTAGASCVLRGRLAALSDTPHSEFSAYLSGFRPPEAKLFGRVRRIFGSAPLVCP